MLEDAGGGRIRDAATKDLVSTREVVADYNTMRESLGATPTDLTPPADCAELARRLEQDAEPLHGRTYHDMIFAAAVLRMMDDLWTVPSRSIIQGVYQMGRDRFYAVEPEGER